MLLRNSGIRIDQEVRPTFIACMTKNPDTGRVEYSKQWWTHVMYHD